MEIFSCLLHEKKKVVCTNNPEVSPMELKDMRRPLSFFGAISAMYTGTTV